VLKHVMKMHGRVEVEFQAFLMLTLDRRP